MPTVLSRAFRGFDARLARGATLVSTLLFAACVGESVVVDIGGEPDTLVVTGVLDTTTVTTQPDTIVEPPDTVVIIQSDTIVQPPDTVLITDVDTVIIGNDTTFVTTTDTVIRFDTVIVTTTDTVVTVDTIVVVDTVDVTTTLIASVSELVLNVGQTASLTVTELNILGVPTTPSDVDWVSDNALVASVDAQGRVTGESVGQTNIYALAAGLFATVPTTVNSGAPPPPPPGGLYANQPAGSTTLTENTMRDHVQDSSGWRGNTWEDRTDAVTFAGATCTGVNDDFTARHNHPGNGSSNADYGGSFDYTPGVTMDTMYVALCLFVNSSITGGGSNHGIKLDFARTEDAGGADQFPTWNASDYFGMHWQSGFSESDDNFAFDMDGRESRPVWFEYLYIASDNGADNGEAHVWIDGEKAYTNTSIDWSDSSSSNCTGSRCGFIGWQMYRNTDEGAGNSQHYLYTSHFYMSYKGVAN